MNKGIVLLTAIAFLLLLLTLGISAETETERPDTVLPNEYEDLLGALPDELRDLLPPSFFSTNGDEAASGAMEATDFFFLLRTVLSLVGLRLGTCVKLLATIAGLLLLSSISSTVKASFQSGNVGLAFTFLSTLIITVSILKAGYESILSVTSYFESLGKMTTALIPLMGVLYTMGGNITSAVASSSALSIFLAILEQLITKSIVPFCGICLAFALIRALDPAIHLGTLSDTLKKNYTTLLAFLMMLLSAMLAAQSLLGSAKDTIAMRSAKFAAGSMIPVVGGSISELLKTVTSSVSYLRSTVGICAIILMLLLLLPTLIELLLIRLTWQIAASLADLLSCDGEKKLLDEMASLSGYLIAAVAICSSVVILALSLLIHCTSALG